MAETNYQSPARLKPRSVAMPAMQAGRSRKTGVLTGIFIGVALIAGIGPRFAGSGSAAVAPEDEPTLVAVQIHADWCPRSPEVAPIFAELLSQYGHEPILFVSLDITDDVRLTHTGTSTIGSGMTSSRYLFNPT